MRMQLSQSELVNRAMADAPIVFDRQLTEEDIIEIFEMFKGTTRNPNTCISKGQLIKVAERLLAQNYILQKRFKSDYDTSNVSV